MAYIVNKSDGSVLATVQDGSINTTSSSITLIGKNYAGYGEAINENFVRMLENFSAAAAPVAPQTGQLWWDTQARTLKIYDAGTWKRTGGASSSPNEPTGSRVTGDFWWDTTNGQLKIYDGSQFILVGPQGGGTAGDSGSLVDTILDNLNVEHVVIKIVLDDTVVAYYSKDAAFVPATLISGFPTIRPGLNLSTTVAGNRVTGNLFGNVTSAGVNTFGSATISAATESESTGSGALIVTGGVGVGGRLNVGGNLAVTSGTAASSTTVAALTVAGGVGVTGSQYIGGSAFVTGNLGVGTTSPNAKLHVVDTNCVVISNGSAGYGSFYALSSGTNPAYIFLGNGGGEKGRITSLNGGELSFATGPSAIERMVIDTNGNLAITASAVIGQDVFLTRADAAGPFIGTSVAAPLRLGTNLVERMRIDTNGNVGIGSGASIAGGRTLTVVNADTGSGSWAGFIGQSNAGSLRIQANSTAAGALGYIATDSGMTNGLVIGAEGASGSVSFQTNGQERLRITAAGTVQAQGDIVAFVASDSRLKTDIKHIDNALDRVAQLNGVEFFWNDVAKETYPERTQRDVGVIAQEVQAVLPEVVTERADGYLAVRYEKLVPLLIEAIKELKSQVQELQSRAQ